MRWVNTSGKPLTITLRGERYKAEPGKEVSPEVPDEFTDVIVRQGYPMKQGGAPSPAPVSQVRQDKGKPNGSGHSSKS